MIVAAKTTLRDKAIQFLAQREHSAFELKQKLAKSYGDDAAIEALLLALKAERLQSDDRFAESYIHYRRRRGYGPSHIASELQHRGVAEEIVARYLMPTSHDWLARARAAFVKKFPHGLAPEYAGRAKQMRFLYQRGFTTEQIQRVCSSEGAEHENG